MEIWLYLFSHRAKPRLVQDGREWKRGGVIEGHVTGQNSDSADSESVQGSTIILPGSSDLAILNPKCHMNNLNYF